jgi:hypothetical protein
MWTNSTYFVVGPFFVGAELKAKSEKQRFKYKSKISEKKFYHSSRVLVIGWLLVVVSCRSGQEVQLAPQVSIRTVRSTPTSSPP